MDIQEQKLYSIKFTADKLDVTIQTLRNWDNNGLFKANRTPSGHRKYLGLNILEKLKNNNKQ